MKNLFAVVLTCIVSLSLSNVTAQVWSPAFAHYSGYITLYGQPNLYGTPISIFQGNVIQGVANGPGNWYFINGDIFMGTFSNGHPNGPGVYFKYGGGYQEGCWSNGYYMGPCPQVRNFYQRRGYGGVDDALVGTTSSAPRSYTVDAQNYNTRTTVQTGSNIRYGGGF